MTVNNNGKNTILITLIGILVGALITLGIQQITFVSTVARSETKIQGIERELAATNSLLQKIVDQNTVLIQKLK